MLKPRCRLWGEQLRADQVSHGRFFSLEPVSNLFSQVPAWEGGAFQGGLAVSGGPSPGSSTEKPLSRK